MLFAPTFLLKTLSYSSFASSSALHVSLCKLSCGRNLKTVRPPSGFPTPSVTFLQLLRSKLTAALEHYSRASVAMLHSSWRNIPGNIPIFMAAERPFPSLDLALPEWIGCVRPGISGRVGLW